MTSAASTGRPASANLVKSIGAMTAAGGGIDALVFTGGIGERCSPVRRAVIEHLEFLGLALGPANEAVADMDTDVSALGAQVPTLVLHSREYLELARQTRELLQSVPQPS